MATNIKMLIRKIHKKIISKDFTRRDYLFYLNNTSLVIIFILFIFLISLPLTKAHFICGKVINLEDGMSANWFDVNVFYPDDDTYTSCEVSPSGNKYCCDIEDIPGKTWKIGDIVKAEIYENTTGYFTSPVSITTTGEGYDVAPEMQLKKAIKIHNPNSRLIFSNKSEFLLNVSFEKPYHDIEVYLNDEKILQGEYSTISEFIKGDFGHNNLFIKAKHIKENRYFNENISFYIIKRYNFLRKISPSNGDIQVKSDEKIEVSINIKLSEHVKNINLIEYIPIKWKILKHKGELKRYSSSHNILIWNVSGKNIIKNYTLLSPSKKLTPRKYVFKTQLDKKIINKSNIEVQGYLPFFPRKKKLRGGSSTRIDFNMVSSSKPIVLNNYSGIDKIAVFPNKSKQKSEFGLINYSSNSEIKNILDYYLFDTDLSKDEIQKVFLQLSLNKTYLQKKGYNNISLYGLQDGKWIKYNKDYFENKKEIGYQGYLPSIQGFAIAGEDKQGIISLFFNKMMSFIKNLFN